MSKIVLLQGPMGYFFDRFASTLQEARHQVFKINFNAGDRFFYPSHPSIDFSGSLSGWPWFFSNFIQQHQIDALILFGDCRKYHQVAIEIAKKYGVEVYVFEEGYIRPDYVTFEKAGVNGNSKLLQDWQDVKVDLAVVKDKPTATHSSFKLIGWNATKYYLVSYFLKRQFSFYVHHRNFSPWYELRCNLLAGWRKLTHKLTEKKTRNIIHQKLDDYFVVPLQISTDSQISQHSKYATIQEFISEVIHSFAQHAKQQHSLVFKHHPLDRGHVEYTQYIQQEALKHGVADRVFYVHDIHLPTLLKRARGVVVINSTVGMSALHHKRRVKVMGEAIYDLPELTYQGTLDKFWTTSLHKQYHDYWKFRTFLVNYCQVHGAYFGQYPAFDQVKLEQIGTTKEV